MTDTSVSRHWIKCTNLDILIQLSCRKTWLVSSFSKTFPFDRAPSGSRLRSTSAWSCRSTSTTRSKTEKDTRWSSMRKYVRVLHSLSARIISHLHNQSSAHVASSTSTCRVSLWGWLALCWMNAISTSSCQYNVPLLCLMNSTEACNCSYAYEWRPSEISSTTAQILSS